MQQSNVTCLYIMLCSPQVWLPFVITRCYYIDHIVASVLVSFHQGTTLPFTQGVLVLKITKLWLFDFMIQIRLLFTSPRNFLFIQIKNLSSHPFYSGSTMVNLVVHRSEQVRLFWLLRWVSLNISVILSTLLLNLIAHSVSKPVCARNWFHSSIMQT